MKTHIQAMDFSLTNALESFIKQHTEKSMRASANLIDHVSVRLKDLNGPKGGCDKECSVEVVIPNSPSIVVTKRNSNAYACIREALGRAARVTLRKISRKRSNALPRGLRQMNTSAADFLPPETAQEELHEFDEFAYPQTSSKTSIPQRL